VSETIDRHCEEPRAHGSHTWLSPESPDQTAFLAHCDGAPRPTYPLPRATTGTRTGRMTHAVPNVEERAESITTTWYEVEARDKLPAEYRTWFPFVEGAVREFRTPELARAAATATAHWYPVYEYRVVHVTITRAFVEEVRA
jgi:hypothetical protein